MSPIDNRSSVRLSNKGRKMIVINLWGAPGSGKSTAAAGLFHEMKIAGMNVELVTEFAKDMVWEEQHLVFRDQLYMLANQNRKLERLRGKVDYVITDSPIPLGLAYIDSDQQYTKSLSLLIMDVFNSYNNINIHLTRNHTYQQTGRLHTEQESDSLDDRIVDILYDNRVPHYTATSAQIKMNCIIPEVTFPYTS